MRKKILFTGGTGLLALNWANLVCDQFDVVLGFHERQIALNKVETSIICIESETEFQKSVDRIKPDCIIHTAAMTNVDNCEYFPELANKINFEVVKIVSNVCIQNNIDLIFISTDQLFDGTISYVSEDHVKNPLNCYGRTKSLGEDYAIENNPDALIVRTNFFGWGTSYRKSFSDFVINNLRMGNRITLFKDVFFTPIWIDGLVNIVMQLYLNKDKGIFNVVGNERISKLEFGKKLAEVFELNLNLIVAGSISSNPKLVKRPKDLSLSNKKVKENLNIEIINLTDQFSELKKNEFNKFSNLTSTIF